MLRLAVANTAGAASALADFIAKGDEATLGCIGQFLNKNHRVHRFVASNFNRWLAIALCSLASTGWAVQRQGNLSVSATVVQIACPAGVTALSCAPYSQTATVVDSYVAAGVADAAGTRPAIEKIEGELYIITVTY